jgi:hypothetical protein
MKTIVIYVAAIVAPGAESKVQIEWDLSEHELMKRCMMKYRRINEKVRIIKERIEVRYE